MNHRESLQLVIKLNGLCRQSDECVPLASHCAQCDSAPLCVASIDTGAIRATAFVSNDSEINILTHP